ETPVLLVIPAFAGMTNLERRSTWRSMPAVPSGTFRAKFRGTPDPRYRARQRPSGEYQREPIRIQRVLARRTDPARPGHRHRDHRGVHRRERVLRPQGRPHLRHLDPGGGDLDGDTAG